MFIWRFLLIAPQTYKELIRYFPNSSNSIASIIQVHKEKGPPKEKRSIGGLD